MQHLRSTPLRHLFAALLGLFLGACSPPPGGPGAPPRPGNLAELDPRVVERVEAACAELALRLDDPRAWAELGMVYETERLRNLAVECYSEAARLDPGEARWWFHRATALGKLGRSVEAIEAIQRSIERFDGYAPSHARLGSYQLERGELGAAEVAFQRAHEIDPTYPGGRTGLARVHLQLDRADAAVAVLEELHTERPHDLLVERLLATAYRQSGRAAEASALGGDDEGSPESDRWPDPWAEELRTRQDSPVLREVTQLVIDGKPQAALEILERLRAEARTVEDERSFLPTLGDLYFDLGRLDDAEGVQRRLLEIQPESSQPHLVLARIHESRGEPEQAVAAALTALRLNPNYAPAYRDAGRIFFKSGLYDKAAVAFEKAVEYDRHSTDMRYLLGMSHLRARSFDAAEATFRELLKEDPQHADGWLALGRTCVRLGRFDEAEQALQSAKMAGLKDVDGLREVEAWIRRARNRAAKKERQG